MLPPASTAVAWLEPHKAGPCSCFSVFFDLCLVLQVLLSHCVPDRDRLWIHPNTSQCTARFSHAESVHDSSACVTDLALAAWSSYPASCSNGLHNVDSADACHWGPSNSACTSMIPPSLLVSGQWVCVDEQDVGDPQNGALRGFELLAWYGRQWAWCGLVDGATNSFELLHVGVAVCDEMYWSSEWLQKDPRMYKYTTRMNINFASTSAR